MDTSEDASCISLRVAQASDKENPEIFPHTVLEGILHSLGLFQTQDTTTTSQGQYLQYTVYTYTNCNCILVLDYFKNTTVSMEAFVISTLYMCFNNLHISRGKIKVVEVTYNKIEEIIIKERSSLYKEGKYTVAYIIILDTLLYLLLKSRFITFTMLILLI